MSLSVLAIDDSRTIRALVEKALSNAGYAVTTAEDGQKGLTTFETDRFDAVITDINMPNLDGFGVIDGIRSGGINQRVPILVLTTETGQDLRDRARQSGATGWIVKPFDDGQLVNVVRRVTGAA